MANKTKIYIVIEYVGGGELFDKISWETKEDEARTYFQQLINAVDFCHGTSIYHRDLKPENLLLDTHGVLKISDFGLSALSQQEDGLLHTARGTPNYVAPERITIPEILQDKWFKKRYKPPQFEQEEDVNLDDIDVAFNDSKQENLVTERKVKPVSMNVFELISRSQSFCLDNLFEKQMRQTSFASQCPHNEIISKIEDAAKPLGFNVDKRNYKMRLKGDKSGRKGQLSVAIE
ncbi:hypothetical protein Gohar_004784, partial [Gossypium harknessii]|nr:hypothetical protein [Gossypium harknessii]